jgi:glycosyltransferase involved in cell wall biosynthesis
VEVTGEVPDLQPHLDEAALALLPLPVARGVQTKVLEALAHGIPVVATTNVLACMEEGAAAAMAVADGPADLAAIAARVLEDGEERRRLGLAARAYVERNHDWRQIDRRWSRLLEEVLLEAGPRSAEES